MTKIAIMLNAAMALPAALMLTTTVLALRWWPGAASEEGRADWRGPSRRRLRRPAR